MMDDMDEGFWLNKADNETDPFAASCYRQQAGNVAKLKAKEEAAGVEKSSEVDRQIRISETSEIPFS